MKVQFATIEAVTSALIIASAISAIGAMMSENNHRAYASLYAMRLGFAEHDFMEQAYGNVSLRNCVAALLNGTASCMPKYERQYSGTYGLAEFNVSTAPVAGSRCFAAPSNGILCFGG